MKVTAGGAIYEFDEDRITNRELMALEKATGLTAVEWNDALSRGSMTAVTALVWLLRRREGEKDLAFDDVEFAAATVNLDQSDDVGKDSVDATERSSKTSSTTTSSPSLDSSGSSLGSSNGLSAATTSS